MNRKPAKKQNEFEGKKFVFVLIHTLQTLCGNLRSHKEKSIICLCIIYTVVLISREEQ